jgi:nucleotide-binding universal stress UspA family protein
VVVLLQDVDESDHEMKVQAKVAVGDARAVICHMADKLGADVLVMGSHGYGFFKRYGIGHLL